MREILFRAKRVKDNQWIYGYYVHQYGAHEILMKGLDEWANEGYHIDSETVGQFTGLTDKNGVKIFEGDIVRVNYNDSDGEDYEDVVLVAYDGESGGFSPYTWNYSCDGCDCGVYVYSVEVIGNIYDNPELLGGTNNA